MRLIQNSSLTNENYFQAKFSNRVTVPVKNNIIFTNIKKLFIFDLQKSFQKPYPCTLPNLGGLHFTNFLKKNCKYFEKYAQKYFQIILSKSNPGNFFLFGWWISFLKEKKCICTKFQDGIKCR